MGPATGSEEAATKTAVEEEAAAETTRPFRKRVVVLHSTAISFSPIPR